MITRCPSCDLAEFDHLLTLSSVPALCNQLCDTVEAARSVPRGDIRLVACRECGLVFNRAFDPAMMRYTHTYENALHYSPQFRAYAAELAAWIAGTLGVRSKRVLEIGCGDGSFLADVCRAGSNTGIGFDPSFDAGRADPGVRASVDIRAEIYQHRPGGPTADLVVCRHVLEHLPDPRAMLSAAASALSGPNALLLFEVPCFLATLEHDAFWDIIYEHVLYFTPNTMRSLFVRSGLEPVGVREVYAGQFLVLAARTAGTSARPTPPIAHDAPLNATFARRFEAFVAGWGSWLDTQRALGRRAVLWGAGSKGVMFLNLAGERAVTIVGAVDLNPRKHSKFIAGTGTPIVAPTDLLHLRPDTVLVMNPLYEQEIRAELARLELAPIVLIADRPPPPTPHPTSA